jgi:hypothetical protein
MVNDAVIMLVGNITKSKTFALELKELFR